jgi:hypothetical protein
MKYQLGDRIILLHSGEEGSIVDFINREMVMVEVAGVTFPAFLDQIDFPYFRDFTVKKKNQEKPKPERQVEQPRPERGKTRHRSAPGVWLSFMPVYDRHLPDEDIVEHFRISLVNQTEDHLRFDYRFLRSGETDFELRNEVLPLSDIYLHDVTLEHMNDSPRFHFVFSLQVPDRKRKDRHEVEFKMRGKQLFRHMEQLLERNEAHFNCLLLESWPEREAEPAKEIGDLGKAGFRMAKPKTGKAPLQSVVDLHIDKIIDVTSGMTPLDILAYQLKTLNRHLDMMVAARQPKLTVIHGLGSGRLKEEVHQVLANRREVDSYRNVHHPLFGFGATEIFFRYE